MTNNNVIYSLGETAIAYLAGFLDGDGCISFYKAKDKYQTAHTNIEFVNTNETVIDWIHKTLKCGYKYEKPIDKMHGFKKSKPQFVYGITNRKNVLALCKLMLPYLIVKNKSARKCVRFTESINRPTRENVARIANHARFGYHLDKLFDEENRVG